MYTKIIIKNFFTFFVSIYENGKTYHIRSKVNCKKQGIKNYQSMSREKSLSTLDKSERISENLSKNGLNKIVKMQNLSLNELEQIERMNNLSLNKLKQIAKTTSIKTNRNTSKEDLY